MKIAAIGEAMVEIATLPDTENMAKVGFGGDTLNSALYAARLLKNSPHSVSYVTLLGDDPYGRRMKKVWEEEGILCEHVGEMEGRETGLYSIQLDEKGEREFHYWRQNAPARTLFDGKEGLKRLDALAEFDQIFFTGITLAILKKESRSRLLSFAAEMKKSGKSVVYDCNHRARLWDQKTARKANEAAFDAATLLLPSSEDLDGVFGKHPNWKDFLSELDVPEIVMKRGGAPLDVYLGDKWAYLALPSAPALTDSTAAGDSFNAGYLAARAIGDDPICAARKAHALASIVIGYPGAIVPTDRMPSFGE